MRSDSWAWLVDGGSHSLRLPRVWTECVTQADSIASAQETPRYRSGCLDALKCQMHGPTGTAEGSTAFWSMHRTGSATQPGARARSGQTNAPTRPVTPAGPIAGGFCLGKTGVETTCIWCGERTQRDARSDHLRFVIRVRQLKPPTAPALAQARPKNHTAFSRVHQASLAIDRLAPGCPRRHPCLGLG